MLFLNHIAHASLFLLNTLASLLSHSPLTQLVLAEFLRLSNCVGECLLLLKSLSDVVAV